MFQGGIEARPVGHIRIKVRKNERSYFLTGHIYLKMENKKKGEIRFCALGLYFSIFRSEIQMI